jgi:hypothetical protein
VARPVEASVGPVVQPASLPGSKEKYAPGGRGIAGGEYTAASTQRVKPAATTEPSLDHSTVSPFDTGKPAGACDMAPLNEVAPPGVVIRM